MPRNAPAFVFAISIFCMANSSAAQPEDGEAERSEPVNTMGAKAALALEFDGDAHVGGGANASYERKLIPKGLQMELVVGAGVNDKAVKIPIGLLFTHAWVPNEVWEPDVGLGGTVTVEGERNDSGRRDLRRSSC